MFFKKQWTKYVKIFLQKYEKLDLKDRWDTNEERHHILFKAQNISQVRRFPLCKGMVQIIREEAAKHREGG